MYPVQTAKGPCLGASIPQGWKIILDANGNPVYVKDRDHANNL